MTHGHSILHRLEAHRRLDRRPTARGRSAAYVPSRRKARRAGAFECACASSTRSRSSRSATARSTSSSSVTLRRSRTSRPNWGTHMTAITPAARDRPDPAKSLTTRQEPEDPRTGSKSRLARQRTVPTAMRGKEGSWDDPGSASAEGGAWGLAWRWSASEHGGHCSPGALQRVGVSVELEVAVGSYCQGVDREGDIFGVGSRGKLTVLHRPARLALE